LAILNDLLRRLDPAKAEVQKAKQSANPQARIESIYHRLLADPEQGADEVWSWGAEWHNTFQYALLHSLIQAGLEHDRAGRLAGRAKGWVYYLHGLLQTIYNEYRAAREALEIAAAYTGGDRQLEANCIQRLGDVHLRLAEYAEARRRYEQALPVYRDIGARLGEANCIKSLGDVHRMLAEYAEARRRYEQAFDRFLDLGLPNDAVGVLVSQAGIYERQYDYEAALPLYVRAVELAPDNPMWYRNRASAYLNLKDPAGAAADIETAARLQPDHPYLHLRRGDLAILQGDYDRALAEFAAFVAAFPSNNGGYFSKTRAHLLRGDSAAALAALDQALALTYEAQDVRDAIYEMEQLQSEHGHLPGLAEALSRLRAWRRQ
jgi:tetratricopeptide (TPR) repeat protein